MKTYWNGEPCKARRVLVRVGEAPVKTWWFANLVGTERPAVEITYGGETFYIDNEYEDGWRKVTVERGGPWAGHRSLEVSEVIADMGLPVNGKVKQGAGPETNRRGSQGKGAKEQ